MKDHRPFSLVLAGGGVRGFSHAGVLHALETKGYRPEAIVGVSMGAVMGTTYALRDDWYSALVGMDTSQFPKPIFPQHRRQSSYWQWLWDRYTYLRLTLAFTLGWGIGEKLMARGKSTLENITREQNLEDARIPLAVCATDLSTGSRVTLRSGPAVDALMASVSIAGIFPPQRRGNKLLVDGVYADIAPVDVARDFSPSLVLVVDPTQSLVSTDIKNGFQAILRAVEICQMRHADLRFGEADYVLRPKFSRTIDTLEFDAKRECIAAGIHAVRRDESKLKKLLEP